MTRKTKPPKSVSCDPFEIRVTAAENRAFYHVSHSWFDGEAYCDRELMLNANELGEYLLQHMPYKPTRKSPPHLLLVAKNVSDTTPAN